MCSSDLKCKVESKGNELVHKNEVISTELRQHEEVGLKVREKRTREKHIEFEEAQ